MNGDILKAAGLCKAYKTKQVLTDLDLTIEPGKIYGLIGRNGAGKTTLLSLLTAQNIPDSGSVTLGGEPVWENQQALDKLCFSRELQPVLFAGQNNYKVRHYLRAAALYYPGWDAAYAQRLLEEFELEPKKRACQLSKGQLSMVAILIALASNAPITILDEPVAGLDVVMRQRFYRLLLDDYARTGRTFILSTHIIEEAASLFERVLVLESGRIIEDCPTDELVDQFRTVTGREDRVDAACAGMQVLASRALGRHKEAVVRDTAGRTAASLAALGDVDVAPMDLQAVFVALCGHETTV